MTPNWMLGLVCGFAACGLYATILNEGTDAVIEFTDKYAPLVAALFVGYLALKGVSKQVQTNVDQWTADRKAKLDASRASLPIVLSNVYSLGENRLHAIASGKGKAQNDEKWTISETELKTIKECIEFSDGMEKEALQQVIRIYQDLLATWPSEDKLVDLSLVTAKSCRDVKPGVRQQLYDAQHWSVFLAVCNSLFPFSRGETFQIRQETIIEHAIFILRHMTNESPRSMSGWALTNQGYYAEFVAQRTSSTILHKNSPVWTSPPRSRP
jgi:hypothetical protein